MVYVNRAGQVVHGNGPLVHRIVALFWSIIDFIVFFFKTIVDPKAAEDYAKRKNKGRGGGSSTGGGGGGGPPRPPYGGPRITGLGNLRDAGGNCAAGA